MSPDAKPAPRLGLALAVISTAQLMVVLDATIVNVALPSIQRGLHFALANLVWVTSAYSLAFGGLLLFGGRTGDLFGRRRMFMVGVALFSLASLFGGLAQSDVWLIVARVAQGIGGAIASPTALSLIATNFPEGRVRTRAMGVYSAMAGAGGAVGLLLGGVLTDLASWRWVLFVNVPIGVAVLLLAPRVLAESQIRRGELDVPGAVLVTGGMALVVYGLTNAATHSWSSSATLICLVAGAVLLTGFVMWERGRSHPLMPLRIFNRNRSAAYAMMLGLGVAVFSTFFFLTQYLQEVLGFSPLKTGLGFLPMTLLIGVSAQAMARVLQRVSVRVPLVIGPALVAGGLFWLSRITLGNGYWDVVGPLALIALGMGTSFVPLTLTAVSGVQAADTGLASALLNTGQQVGGAIGLALLSTVSVTAIRTRLSELARTHSGRLTGSMIHGALVHGWDLGYLVASLIAFGVLVVSVVTLRARDMQPAASHVELADVPA